jgi:hypothetical protein
MLINLQLHNKKIAAKNGYDPAISDQLIKKIALLALAFLIFNVAYAQRALKITRMREITWSQDSKTWTPWPTTWTDYAVDKTPIITIYNEDTTGYLFKVHMQIGTQQFDFEVAYNGFDDKNNWTKYMDQNGDEISIVGSTMSQLLQNGWPAGTTVNIYFWLYSSYMAFELE